SQNPADGKTWASFACTDKQDVERAVVAAKRALDNPEWRDMTQTARGKLLFKLADLIEQHAGRLGELETQDSGKLLAETATQTKYVADYYRYYAGLADKMEGAVLPIDKPDMHVFTKRMPIGVVAAVVPWNAQMFLSATKLGPALAAGCSEVDRIAFTGGPETARHVVRNSAENFALTTLELGGKSPILVFEDADLDSAANGLIAANFGASGQSCVAGSRGLIHRSILPELIARIKDKASGIVVGDPLNTATHVGPLCTGAQIDRIVDTLDKAQSQGATIHFGGAPLERDGNYMAPTLVECPSEDTETLHIEMFGPVMSLIPFDTEEEAIMMANNSQFGLGSGVFTQNIARAHRVSDRIRSGICWVNTYRAISPIAPFGGFNQSGYGREAGQDAILDYTRTKTTWINTSD
ncbi:MAG: aldehyde dehydrogenase, partial [Rhodobacteraceae bacterium]|nr:aldehyde dehydrogenase [Paracoccaceae bacterium]